MATRIRNTVFSMLVLAGWLFLLSPAMAGDAAPELELPDEPSLAASRAISIPDGEALPAPTTVRSFRYQDGDALPQCLECVEGVWTTLFDEQFTTDASTSYVEVDWSGQFTLTNTTPTVRGIRFRVVMVQGTEVAFFPWAGPDGSYPYIARNDFSGNGSSWHGGYHGFLLVEPDTTTRVAIQLRADIADTYACFQNMTIRHD